MGTRSWNDLRSEIKIDGDLSPVSDQQLDSFEAEQCVKLPHTYREFCKTFGPGRLRGVISVKFAVPGKRTWPWDADIALLNEYASNFDRTELEEYCPDPEVWWNGLFFGTGDSGWYLWNKTEPTDEVRKEMAVYLISREMQVHRLADTFESFIFDICLDKGVPGTYPSILAK